MKVFGRENERRLGCILLGELALSLGELGLACAGGKKIEIDLDARHWRALCEQDDAIDRRRSLIVRVSLVEHGTVEPFEAPTIWPADAAPSDPPAAEEPSGAAAARTDGTLVLSP